MVGTDWCYWVATKRGSWRLKERKYHSKIQKGQGEKSRNPQTDQPHFHHRDGASNTGKYFQKRERQKNYREQSAGFMKWKLWLTILIPFNKWGDQLGGWGGSSGCWLLHPHQGGFWHYCNIFTDKQMKYGLCKCSEVDWKLADGPEIEGCGEQQKVQMEANAVPQVPQHYLDLYKWPEKWDIVHYSWDCRWYKTSGGCGEPRWTRWRW